MNARKSEKKEARVRKPKPTNYPMGFAIKKLEDEIIILDFIDKDFENDEDFSYVITSSIALSKKRALELKEALEKAINNDEDI